MKDLIATLEGLEKQASRHSINDSLIFAYYQKFREAIPQILQALRQGERMRETLEKIRNCSHVFDSGNDCGTCLSEEALTAPKELK